MRGRAPRIWVSLFISGTGSDTQHKHLLNERLTFKAKADPAGQLRNLLFPMLKQLYIVLISLDFITKYAGYIHRIQGSINILTFYLGLISKTEEGFVRRTFSLNHSRVSCRHEAPSPPNISVCVPTNEDIILHHRNTAIRFRSLVLTDYHHLIHAPHSDFFSGSAVSFVAKESSLGPHTTWSCHVSSLLQAGRLPRSFPDFHDVDLTIWDFTDESSFRISFSLALSDYFLII